MGKSEIEIEEQYVEELKSSNRRIREGYYGPKMRMALKFENADESKVYVISHVPDQLEDTYFLLYNMDYIVIVDIPKFDDGEIIVKNVPIGEYKKNLTKRNRRKLQVAIRMISAQK